MVDNICAIATPYGTGAISIIRCSGPNAIELVNNVFKGKNLTKVKSHTMNYGYIMDGEERVDEVLCNVFIAPKSFDGENTVEINCHGGVYVTNMILRTLLKNGFRMAERGEFSSRAYYNNKIDLIQAEAILSMVEASSVEAKKLALYSLEGQTSELIKPLINQQVELLMV